MTTTSKTRKLSKEDWYHMAHAIAGSGSYGFKGAGGLRQVQVLAEWFRKGERLGYEWRPLYAEILGLWGKDQRPLFPDLAEMAELVDSENIPQTS